MSSVINTSEETLDLQAVVAELAAGRAAHARALFAARPRWLLSQTEVVADLTARLRQGASPAELTGPLANDPAALRANGLAARAGAITGAANANQILYTAIKPSITASNYSHWADDVWDTKDSSFVRKKTPKDALAGEFVYVARPNGITTGDAIYMHLALMARARGKTGFVVYTARPRLDMTWVRFGDPGDPGIPTLGMVDAATVIAALSEEFPDPKAPKAEPKKSPAP